jgi:serine/threonine-protein kinase
VLACPTCHSEYDPVVARYCSHCGAEVKVAGDDGEDAWIGKVIDGRYRVQARVGTGGMGAVYRVEHVRMGKVAAMKVLHRELAKEDQIVKRFRREVEVVSRLNHPNIVQTFDFGSWEGLLYLIMEFVKGEDLGAIIKREGPLPVPRAIALGVQICSALDEAHHLGVMHRDLKPENIVCVRRRDEEHAKVLDFGLAKLRERPGLGEITGAGNLIGTPYYMSPEQVRSEAVDHRTDIYSLGGTLYRVVTGQFPFDGNSPMGIMSKHLTDELVPPSERAPEQQIPPELDRIILRAMARNRDQRYGSAGEMRHDLEALLGIASGDRARSRSPTSAPRSIRSRATAATCWAASSARTSTPSSATSGAAGASPRSWSRPSCSWGWCWPAGRWCGSSARVPRRSRRSPTTPPPRPRCCRGTGRSAARSATRAPTASPTSTTTASPPAPAPAPSPPRSPASPRSTWCWSCSTAPASW